MTPRRAPRTRRVLIVCTGNLCRSPLGEHLLRRHLAARGVVDVAVHSAGTGAVVGEGVPEPGRRLAAERGVDVSAHRARDLDEPMLREADLVLCAAARHVRGVFALAPDLPMERVALLRDALPDEAGRDIDDPYRQDDASWRQVVGQLDACTAAWAERLAG